MSNVPFRSIGHADRGNASFFIGVTLPGGHRRIFALQCFGRLDPGRGKRTSSGMPRCSWSSSRSPPARDHRAEITVIDLPNKALSNNKGQVIFRNGQTVAFAVRNDGNAPLVVRSAKTVVNPNEFRTTPLTRTLAPGASATVQGDVHGQDPDQKEFGEGPDPEQRSDERFLHHQPLSEIGPSPPRPAR